MSYLLYLTNGLFGVTQEISMKKVDFLEFFDWYLGLLILNGIEKF